MTRLLLLMAVVCAPVMADEPRCLDVAGDSYCEPTEPPVRVESNYTSIYSTVLGTTKMRCVITGEGPVVRDKYIVVGQREFYIECEPVTEEQ